MSRRPFFVAVLALLIVWAYGYAAIVYKDSTSPTGIPDFKQVGGVCWKVAMANCFWYWDHHGYAGLVPHSAGDPGDWKKDGQSVIDELVKLNKNHRWNRATAEYIKQQGKHYVERKQDGLVVEYYRGDAAKYSLFKRELSRCQDVIPAFKAHKTGGGANEWIKVGPAGNRHDYYHAMTAAGWDDATPPTQVALTDGWDGDETNVVDPANYRNSSIQNPTTNGDRLRINGNADRDYYGCNGNYFDRTTCDYLEMVAMITVCPKKNDADARGAKGEAEPEAGPPEMMRYTYTLTSYTDSSLTNEEISVFGVSIDVPFVFGTLNIQSPPGWYAVEWVPSTTPGLAPPNPFVDPNDTTAIDTTVADWNGILWLTTTDPLYPEDTLCCFSYELPDIYDISYDASYAVVSSTTEDTSSILSSRLVVGPMLAPTKVGLSSFSATCHPGYVLLEWTTATEMDNAGFRIRRGRNAECRHSLVKGPLTPGRGSGIRGATYTFADRDITPGVTYYYWLEDVDLSGESTMHGPISVTVVTVDEKPDRFILAQNQPNPFRRETAISYTLPRDSGVTVAIYDAMGRKVRTLVDDYQAAGPRTAYWDCMNDDGTRVAGGIYYYRLEAGGYSEMRKMTVLR